MGERIVVTGLGLVTPLGGGRETVWEGLLAGRCGVGPVESFDTAAYSVHLGGEIKGFDPRPYVRRLDVDSLGRASQLAVAAARMALDDAGIAEDELEPLAAGVAMGTTSGEAREVEHFNDCFVERRLADVGDRFMRQYPCHLIPEQIATELALTGVNIMIPTACAAGSYAIAYAHDALRAGRAKLMLAGGADCFSRITYTGFARLGAVAPERCQPFDRHRQGMIPGEGAGILVLETESSARRRGARIYAEIAGYGLSCDAHHMTAAHPEGAGLARAMEQALADGGVDPAEVGYVSAHGTGTPTNDRLETMALERVFNGRAGSIPVSSIKSMLGHTMGAASAIEAAVCSLAVAENRVPPTIHFEEPDPECAVDCVPNEAREVAVGVAMNNASAFGGNNASMLFRSYTS